MSWFSRTKDPVELMKKRKEKELVEALKCMALEVTDSGRMTNHGLSEYGARKLMESGKEPGPLDRNVLLDNGTFITYYEWVERNGSHHSV